MCWVCNAQSAVTILKVGSMKPWCHAVVVGIWDLVHNFDIWLHYAWQSCDSPELQVFCDELSKNFDSSEYKLSPQGFELLLLHQIFGPFCLDLFASPFSHLFTPFCSRFLCKGTTAVDAFTIDWGSLTNVFFILLLV